MSTNCGAMRAKIRILRQSTSTLRLTYRRKRLDEKGVKIQTAFTDKETVKNETPVNACTAYDMGECKSNIASKTYEVTEKYFKDGKKKKKIKDRFFFYTMITRLENQNSEVACSCPNCGAVSSVRELLNGCKTAKLALLWTICSRRLQTSTL